MNDLSITRRRLLSVAGRVGAGSLLSTVIPFSEAADENLESGRPPLGARKFQSKSVEAYLIGVAARISDPTLRTMFTNCFPNTLDTTVEPGTFEGHPDTVVLTGDIPAMWLRDSSAQVWPYLPLAKEDLALRELLEGVIRRQARCILIDPYANSFMADLNKPPLEWSLADKTEMKPGVGERKYEIDSLCYPIRLAHRYWTSTGDTGPFDGRWREAMKTVVQTLRAQQKKNGLGTYRFQRKAENPTDSLVNGVGNPSKPIGLITSAFRPSDDACIFPFLIPSNLFAVTSLRQLAEMAKVVLKDESLAMDARSLSDEVAVALVRHGTVNTSGGRIWAYEVDGFGGHVLMDDANVPSLLGLPYLASSPDRELYRRTRRFVWSKSNPWFFRGTAGEGIGGPHIGPRMIWPMSQMIYALTSESDDEIRMAVQMLKRSSAGTGFMHESYDIDSPEKFTRAWFAWANTLFGELIGTLAVRKRYLLT